MKIPLRCRLFGHDFKEQTPRKDKRFKGEVLWIISPRDWCVKCGLKKSDLK